MNAPAAIFGLALLCIVQPVAAAAAISLRPANNQGVDVLADKKVVAPIRLSSNGVIVADRVTVQEAEVRLTGLRCKDPQAVAFAPDDFVSIVLGAMPEVRFRLTIARFDPARWQALFPDAKAPFHFLTCSMPTAMVWHQRGWLNATPNADPFPLLKDVHTGSPEISCLWNRNWSYICPLGAHPIPMIGLWDPPARLYVGYDFQAARAAEQSERYLATAYCWQQGQDKSFVALAFPHGGVRYGELVYPKIGQVLESHFELIIDPELPDTEDPNERFQARLFERYRAALPQVPAMNDLSWIPGSHRLRDFMGPIGLDLWGPGGETTFYPQGTILIHGWAGHREMPIEAALRRADSPAIEAARKRLEELLHKYAQRTTIGGDSCLFWNKPLEGAWRAEWGGPPVTTLHNTDAWYPARVLIELYRYDRARGQAKPEYLQAIDGIFNWTRHFVWTRNEFADVPSSPFAIGGTLSVAFLMDYHFTFQDDPQRRENAELALKLARNVAWRYLPVWAMDSDRFDGALDSAFLIEPNSGRDWAGLACANEVHWNIDTLTQVYVHGGDARMRYYLRGILQRWPALYRENYEKSLAEYGPDSMTEGLGFFDGSGPGRGGRYGYGVTDHLPLNEPVGDSKLRVVAGQRACIGFCKGGSHSDVTEYRTDGKGACAFRIISSLPGEFDLSFSYPYVDVSALPVRIVRGTQQLDLRNEQVRRPAQAPSSLYIGRVRHGDVIRIGELPPVTPPLNIDAPLTYHESDPIPRPIGDFTFLHIQCDTALSQDWTDLDSFAGLIAGMRWVYGVPYWQRASARSKPVQLPATEGTLFIAYAPVNQDAYANAPTFTLDDGTGIRLAGHPAIAWRGWPPIYKRFVMIDQLAIPQGRSLRAIDPGGTLLVAATAVRGTPNSLTTITETMSAAARQERETFQAGQRIRQRLSAMPAGRIALLPGIISGPAASFAGSAGLSGKWTRISPQQLIDSRAFNAQRYPVAFHLGGEDYIKTVRIQGDGKNAIIRYLAEGGMLIILPSDVFPFYYGGGVGGGKGSPDPLLPALGLPLGITFETAPADLRMRRRSAEILGTIPDSFAFPAGDPRLRSVDRLSLEKSHRYLPLISVVGPDGHDYGDAVCYIEFAAGPAKGGRVLYVWSSLIASPEGRSILGDAVAWALEKAFG
ncbi:MAG: hypothetical protein ABSH20_11100 [Tepidisphaeraceae bacterium]|jgi:hypothetical protein